jgi:hypothetical protein
MLLVVMSMALDTLRLGLMGERVMLIIGKVRVSLWEPGLGMICS